MIIRKLAQVLCALTLFAACLLGQTVSSGLQGTVMDPANAVVPGATVTLTNADTGATRATTTDSTGLFRFLDLAPDTYTVSVKATGLDRKSTRLNSSHLGISYAVFCLKKKKI